MCEPQAIDNQPPEFYEFSVSISKKVLLESYYQAFFYYIGPKGRWIRLFSTILLVVLIPVGTIALVSEFYRLVFHTDLPSEIWLLVVMMLPGFAFIGSQNFQVHRYAQTASKGSLFKYSKIQISRNGVTFGTKNSLWQTKWDQVDAVIKGRHAIFVLVSGLSLPIPISGLLSLGEDPNDAFIRMQTWNKQGKT